LLFINKLIGIAKIIIKKRIIAPLASNLMNYHENVTLYNYNENENNLCHIYVFDIYLQEFTIQRIRFPKCFLIQI
jgi:hypothetical protein